MSTRAAFATLPRPVRPLTLPGGGTVHVRDLTVRELRRVDELTERTPLGESREMRLALLVAAFALAEPDGSPAFPEVHQPGVEDVDVSELEVLTTSQIEAVCRAAVPTKGDAKN
jgi:hypothetical protein